MKFSLRLFLVLLACCVAPLLRAADDDSAARRTQAEALLHAMHTEQVLTTATVRVHQMVDKYSQQSVGTQTNLSPEQQAAVKKAQEDAHAIINQQLGWDAVKNDFIQAYADAFTEDELKGLVAFYSSPLGQKLVEKQPAVTEKMGHLTQQKMMTAMPAVMAKIKESAPKPVAASPAPATAPVSPTPLVAHPQAGIVGGVRPITATVPPSPVATATPDATASPAR